MPYGLPDVCLGVKEFGQFYYRFPEGESCADVYDRASLFLEPMHKQHTAQANHRGNIIALHKALFNTLLNKHLILYIE